MVPTCIEKCFWSSSGQQNAQLAQIPQKNLGPFSGADVFYKRWIMHGLEPLKPLGHLWH